jgi:hypothetical protein
MGWDDEGLTSSPSDRNRNPVGGVLMQRKKERKKKRIDRASK